MKLPAIILLILTAFLASCYGAQQTINIGTTPSDGTGDSLRNAFTKVNANFTELYSLSAAINASNITTGTLPIARLADGSVTNAKLANSSITLNGTPVSLGGSIDITASTNLTGLTDVTITSAATNDFLVKSAGDWVNLTPANARTALGLSSAGGVLSGTYPSPGFAVDMVEQTELTTALTTLNASNLTTGTLPIARIADGAITLAKLASSATTTGGNGAADSGRIPLLNAGGGLVLGTVTGADDAPLSLRIGYGYAMSTNVQEIGTGIYSELNGNSSQGFHAHVTSFSTGSHVGFDGDMTGGSGINYFARGVVNPTGYILYSQEIIATQQKDRFSIDAQGDITWYKDGTTLTSGSDKTSLVAATPNGTGIITLPAGRTGTVVTTGDTGTVTGGMLATSYLPLAGGTMTGALNINAGTATASTPALNITQTWNNAGVSFQGSKIAFTDTASSIASEYFGLYAGAAGSTKVLAASKVGGANVIEFPSARSTSNTWSLDFGVVGFALGSTRRVQWSNTVNYYDSADLSLERSAANVLGIKGVSSSTGSAVEMVEMTAPSTPSADRGRLYLEDNGSGKSRLVVKWADGSTSVIATQP